MLTNPAGIGEAGQAWQDVIGSRVYTTIYYNTTGRPLAVAITLRDTGAKSAVFLVDGVEVAYGIAQSEMESVQIFAIVKPGGSYQMTPGATPMTIIKWAELK